MGWNYLSTLGFKLIRVSKRGPWRQITTMGLVIGKYPHAHMFSDLVFLVVRPTLGFYENRSPAWAKIVYHNIRWYCCFCPRFGEHKEYRSGEMMGAFLCDCSESWQPTRQHYCRGVWPIAEPYCEFNMKSRCFETSRDLPITRRIVLCILTQDWFVNQFSPFRYFLNFSALSNPGYPLNITIIFDRSSHSSAAVTPIKYESDLTYWGRDKMADISQTIFSNAFFWMKKIHFD